MMSNRANTFKMIAKTLTGFENVLAGELTKLGAEKIRIVKRGVQFWGDKEMLYKVNYLCRAALRIIMPIAVFKAHNENQLYEEVGKIDWTSFMGLDNTFAIDGITSYSNITHSKYLALKTKDAIVDQFREKYGKRPNIDKDNPDFAINIRVFKDEATVSLDSSGESLHKRGYRVSTGPAPMNEVLAAGLVLISGYDGSTDFIDPMCGSGTLPIEAALIAKNIPSGYFREDYSFKRWKDFDNELWEKVKTDAEAEIRDIDRTIIGSDWSGRILTVAKENVESAGLSNNISLRTSFFNDLERPGGNGIIVMNPPYGERIKTSDIMQLYKSIGDTLKNSYQGYQAWIISSNLDAFKYIGLKPSRNMTIFNGPLECRFACFDMYEGSKKTFAEKEKKTEERFKPSGKRRRKRI
ncbi:MAG: THUMP domain-containing protein [Bacteroidales bacterium]